MLFKTAHHDGRGTHPALREDRPLRALTPHVLGFSLRSADMSLPVVLPGSCCPVTGTAPHSEPPHRNRPRGLSASSRMTGGGSRLLLPGRPLLSLGLLQLLLGGSMVALSFGALSLSNSRPIRNSCPFWAGSSVSSPPCAVVDGCSPPSRTRQCGTAAICGG